MKIVIFQSNKGGLLLAKTATEELGLVDQVCLVDKFDKRQISDLFHPNERQLFIAGTDHGIPEDVIDFVAELRQNYPMLICRSFTTMGNLTSPPFQGEIDRRVPGGPIKALMDAIEEFLKEEK